MESCNGRECLGVTLDVIVAVIQEIKMGKKLKAWAGNLADNQFAHLSLIHISCALDKSA